jgi:hypothetical protein
MSLPSLSYTAKSIWRIKEHNAPFLIANIILIGLIGYRLAKDSEMSKDEKKNISYAEIAFSFIGSLIVLLWCCAIIMILFGTSRHSYLTRVLYLLVPISILLLSPFSSTVLQVALDNKLSDLQEKIISGFTILSALFSIYFTANVLNGAFFD